MEGMEEVKQLSVLLLILGLPLMWLFRQQLFHHDYVGFSNDGPLGTQHAQQVALPESITGVWEDLNYIGKQDPAIQNASAGIRMICEHPVPFLIIAIFPFLFITLRWSFCWAIVWLNVTLFVCLAYFGLGMIFGWIDPYNTSLWLLGPITQLSIIPSALGIAIQEGLNEGRQILPDMIPTWAELKSYTRSDWAIIAYVISVPTLQEPLLKYLIK
jgi:hypothetical protein